MPLHSVKEEEIAPETLSKTTLSILKKEKSAK